MTFFNFSFCFRKIEDVYFEIAGQIGDLDLVFDRDNGIDFGLGNRNDSQDSETNVVGVVFIILSSILAVMFVFLVIAYAIRVKQ